MENKIIDFDLLVADANNLSNAINGLEDFFYYRLGTDKTNLNDMNKLSGLIASVKALSDKHVKELSLFHDGGK